MQYYLCISSMNPHLAILLLATVCVYYKWHTEMIYAHMVGGISTLHMYYIMCIEYEHKKAQVTFGILVRLAKDNAS